MSDMKPSKNYIAKAVQDRARRVWYAQWAAPGLTPRYVLDGESPQIFQTSGTAEVAAMRTLYDALNATRIQKWSGRRELMPPEEFAARLAEANISIADAAIIFGSRPERIMEMIRGIRQVPFFAWWALDLFRDDQELADRVFDIALNHTDESREESDG